MQAQAGSISDVAGLQVGHYTDLAGATGCTVVLCPTGAAAAVDVRGGAPATRETDLLRPGNLVQQVHAVLLTGGSAFGLAAAQGVVEYLAERDIGFATSAGPVPIVPAAALFDLGVGDRAARPDARSGYAACATASDGPVAEGSVGAGTGATVGHLRGIGYATKGGLGTAGRRLESGAVVGALVAVNAFGDVVDPTSGRLVAGPRSGDGRGFVSTVEQVGEIAERAGRFGEHTTLAVVATSAALDRAALTRVAAMAHDGLGRAIQPAHTSFDGDIVFALATGRSAPVDATIVGTVAARVLAEAIIRAVSRATGLAGVPAAGEVRT